MGRVREYFHFLCTLCVEWMREDDHHRVPEVCDDGRPATRLLQGSQFCTRSQDGQGDHSKRSVVGYKNLAAILYSYRYLYSSVPDP
jgi:hypothetical protein